MKHLPKFFKISALIGVLLTYFGFTNALTINVASELLPTPSKTQTSTITLTPTNTFTITPTFTLTPTITNTPTITLTPTITNTPTISLTPTNTFTPTTTLLPIDGVSCIPSNEREIGYVTNVVDGDTFDATVNGETVRIRLIGIDAPEPGVYFADQSKTFLQQAILYHNVTLIKDVSNTDRYDRLLRYVVTNSAFVNYELVAQGYASAKKYEPDTACSSIFADGMNSARVNKVGYWAPTSTPRPTYVAPPAQSNCHPSYPDVCIPYPPPDLDCGDIPYRRFRVVGSDPHHFDGDHDGIGCEG